MSIVEIIALILGSNLIVTLITLWVNKRNRSVDIASQSITALANLQTEFEREREIRRVAFNRVNDDNRVLTNDLLIVKKDAQIERERAIELLRYKDGIITVLQDKVDHLEKQIKEREAERAAEKAGFIALEEKVNGLEKDTGELKSKTQGRKDDNI